MQKYSNQQYVQKQKNKKMQKQILATKHLFLTKDNEVISNEINESFVCFIYII